MEMSLDYSIKLSNLLLNMHLLIAPAIKMLGSYVLAPIIPKIQTRICTITAQKDRPARVFSADDASDINAKMNPRHVTTSSSIERLCKPLA